MSVQTHAFQAEVAQLLHLVTHSLYSNKEIFLRELISNASDACDKLRFEALHQADLYEDTPDLAVRISFDQEAKTLTVSDSGIGMSEEEVIANLGTIARSGTREFVQRLKDAKKGDAALIGQFGVGFYSGFMVADHIVVETRRAGLKAEQGVRWTSAGSGDYTVETITQAQRGTRVTLHMREDSSEYLSTWRLKSIVNKYADHIGLPVLMQKEQWDKDAGKSVQQDEWETVNQASALWTRPKSEITDEQYRAFYQHIAHDSQTPLTWSHNRVEGSSEYTQLLFIPTKAPFDLYQRERAGGIRLYVKRVFIMDDAQDLLPGYLRFVKGVVDSADLPLNVSRELLQESRDVRAIREGNTRRVLSMLEDLVKAERYHEFWSEFGPVLKEGLGEDHGNRERLAKLLRFASTHNSVDDTQNLSLADYVARMKKEQESIYYLIADSLSAARNSPQLEVFRKKGIEVLLLSDKVDEWAMSFLQEFEGKPLQSVAKGSVDLGKLQDEAEKQQAEAAAAAAGPLVEKLAQALEGQAKQVRVTTRLVDSPACLVVEDGDYSMQLARLLKQAGQTVPTVLPILEINPDHATIKRIAALAHDAANSQGFKDWAQVLFDQALLAEGGLPDNPAGYVRRVNALLTGT